MYMYHQQAKTVWLFFGGSNLGASLVVVFFFFYLQGVLCKKNRIQSRFCSLFWLFRLKIGLHGEHTQLLQNKRKQFIQERDKVKEEVSCGLAASVDGCIFMHVCFGGGHRGSFCNISVILCLVLNFRRHKLF